MLLPPPDGFLLFENVTYRTKSHVKIFDDKLAEINENDFAAAAFVSNFQHLARTHHNKMRDKGFWKTRDAIMDAAKAHMPDSELETVQSIVDSSALALVTTETSEAVEALRHGNGPDDKIPHHCGAAAELADVILRIMDLAYGRNWDVAQALVDKMQMNSTRENLHGKKF